MLVFYLEDFLFSGKGDSPDCLELLNKFREIVILFGILLAEEKNVSPCTCLKFLVITIDTKIMEFRLPEAKIIRTK